MDNSIQVPRITNNTVVILNTLLSSQRAAWKTRAILGKLEGLACSEAAGVPIRYAVVPFMGFPVYFLFGAPRVFRVVAVAFPNAMQ